MIEDDPLLPDERAAFAALPRDIQPPPHLEQRVVGRLRVAGALRSSRPWRRVLTIAAAAALFIGGFGLGRVWQAGDSVSSGSRYLLLLYGAETDTPEAEASRVAEYADWARAEAAAGRLLSGEQLSDDTIVVRGDGLFTADMAPSGFFVIRATSRAEAETIAERCPHVRHGGTIVVKPLIE